MTDPLAAIPVARPAWRDQAGRLARLAAKELKEVLRDRRTILTLVLMPLLLYPLLTVAFKQLFLSSTVAAPTLEELRVGFESPENFDFFKEYLELGERVLAKKPGGAADTEPPPSRIRSFEVEDTQQELSGGLVDVVVRCPPIDQAEFDRSGLLAVDCDLLFSPESSSGRRGARFMQSRILAANEQIIATHLSLSGSRQRPVPVEVRLTPLASQQAAQTISLAALIPLILILMTITGAVYPAIDLTAGERERGTLEILVAAPVPRMGLLLAKYAAVLTVALLTAVVNLVMMSVTLAASGLGPLVYGADGLSAWMVLGVLGLLVLFAAFFSAVILTLTSFARSFKEAQAYLIPLMLASLGPGMLGLMPGLTLEGPLVIAPLVNIVLMGRDLLQNHPVGFATAAAVVVSTVLYASAALALAARLFGAEAVLYSAQSGWKDALRRPEWPQPAASLPTALLTLAILFPATFLVTSSIAQWGTGEGSPAGGTLFWKFALVSLATMLLYGALPLAMATYSRVQLSTGFNLNVNRRAWWAMPAALVLGVTLWMGAHEIVLFTQAVGLVDLDEKMQQIRELLDQWRKDSPVWILVSIAVVAPVFEEFFFRGFLLAAIRRRAGAWTTILATAGLFGLFHVVDASGFSVARLLPSFLLGVVLGWLCWRSGSVVPGMVLHVFHNGLLSLTAYYQPQVDAFLRQWSVVIDDQRHLPWSWLAVGAVAAGLAVVWVEWGRMKDEG
jgi:ABC-2 type transport system permease protein/sodium transport system permease protein